jgi:DNA-binding NarL/FixJ family response regulator
MPGPGELPAERSALIVGRDAGLARLRALVDPAPPASRVLLVTGEAGMGKTVLLADTAERARLAGMRVLRVTGRESESRLAFAGLHQLLRPVLTSAAGLPGRQAQALLGALGLSAEPGDADPLLSPQQRQIVRLASNGLTDREIGDRLFLSPRTVASHLYRSYPKLGVASRHQLRDVIARAGTPATAHESTADETLL